jgi:hypothetical protein
MFSPTICKMFDIFQDGVSVLYGHERFIFHVSNSTFYGSFNIQYDQKINLKNEINGLES